MFISQLRLIGEDGFPQSLDRFESFLKILLNPSGVYADVREHTLSERTFPLMKKVY